ncbi:PSPA7_2676 family Cys-rich small protein [Pseudomonas capeferrum]|nr:PSPA7_2676 family Cys-rich small protein [Pseudomonas capeferrum]
MTFVCLLRGCHWRATLIRELTGLQCHCCERCGALRYCRPGTADQLQ